MSICLEALDVHTQPQVINNQSRKPSLTLPNSSKSPQPSQIIYLPQFHQVFQSSMPEPSGINKETLKGGVKHTY